MLVPHGRLTLPHLASPYKGEGEKCVQESTAGPTPAALTDPDLHVRFVSRCLVFPNMLLSGAVAQLGARVNGIHEVAGSIPASSTNYS